MWEGQKVMKRSGSLALFLWSISSASLLANQVIIYKSKAARRSSSIETEIEGIFGSDDSSESTKSQNIKITLYNYYLDDHSSTAISKLERFVEERSGFELEAKCVFNFLEYHQLDKKIKEGGITKEEMKFMESRFDHGYEYSVMGIAQECKDLGIKKFPSYVFHLPGDRKAVIAGRDVDLEKTAKKLKLIARWGGSPNLFLIPTELNPSKNRLPSLHAAVVLVAKNAKSIEGSELIIHSLITMTRKLVRLHETFKNSEVPQSEILSLEDQFSQLRALIFEDSDDVDDFELYEFTTEIHGLLNPEEDELAMIKEKEDRYKSMFEASEEYLKKAENISIYYTKVLKGLERLSSDCFAQDELDMMKRVMRECHDQVDKERDHLALLVEASVAAAEDWSFEDGVSPLNCFCFLIFNKFPYR